MHDDLGPLVSTETAEKLIGVEGVVFLEVDEDEYEYVNGHVPGAVWINWRTELLDPVRRGPVAPADFAALLAARGIADTDTVIVYSGDCNLRAATTYWYLRLYGHPSVALLDGGRKRWILDERPLETDAVVREPATYRVPEADHSLRAFREEVIASIGERTMLDVRYADEFAGTVFAPGQPPHHLAHRAGRIPGAVNVPWTWLTNEDDTFRSPEELEGLLARAGARPGRPTIVYCWVGARSSHTWFVLQELLGWRDVKNYDGSWAEYGSLIDAPIELPS